MGISDQIRETNKLHKAQVKQLQAKLEESLRSNDILRENNDVLREHVKELEAKKEVKAGPTPPAP